MQSNQKASLYGFHAVRAAWLNPARTVHALYLTDQSKAEFEAVIVEGRSLGLRRPVPQMVDKKYLEKLLPRDAVHQGIALVCSPLEGVDIQDMIIRAETKGGSLLVMLDQVTDPHNVGAILRSACAFGADGMIMQRKHAPELEGPTGSILAKTACGAIDHVPVAYETNLSRAIEELKENGFFVYGLAEEGARTIGEVIRKPKMPRGSEANPLTPAQPFTGEKIVLVLGSEGYGLRRLVKENCDELVRLPTSGPIASLNVSNAAAVALYALAAR